MFKLGSFKGLIALNYTTRLLRLSVALSNFYKENAKKIVHYKVYYIKILVQ